MFVVKVIDGLYDGQTILSDGWIPFSANPKELSRHFGLKTAVFDDLSDAQGFVINNAGRVQRGYYGVGASLIIEEIDGDIKYERY